MVRTAPVLVLGSVVSVQLGQALGKGLFSALSPSGVVALRLGIAAAALVALHRPRLPCTPRGALPALGFGTAIAGMNLIYPALARLPLGTAVSVQLLGPIALALLCSRRLADAAFAALAACGVWLFHGPGGAPPFDGLLFALASGTAMAAYLLLSRNAGRAEAPAATLTLAVCWAALLWLPAGIAVDGATLYRPAVLLTGATVAVLSAVIPYSLDLAALRRLPPRTVGILESLEPAVAGIAGVVVLAEVLSAPQWAAIGCVCAAGAGAVATEQGARNRSVT
ncbi:EamA family transporter [Prauserella muralis]|uniref:EamA family transporter n=1 Tax=Prauserella muralis TaxID=588067 RepID=A0A2V4B8I7_9PSEU|nr:EamA family transporter [Prauserella muralis]PXY31674.1 EamA family transporter [Prauserella muralis]TWE13951.1 inner membrane transporter RhtA [Prauserella muralis]